MGKKYIIELEDENYHQYSDSEPSDYLWRVKGFNALVFDEVGISKLTPYTEPDLEQVRKEAYQKGYETGYEDGYNEPGKNQQEAYQRGLADAWGTCKKIGCYEIDGGYPATQMLDLFDRDDLPKILSDYTASEAIEKIRQYEQRQEEQIQVGDEVITASGKAVVTGVGPIHFEYDNADGSHGFDKVKNVKKTGRHFPEIAAVLEKMRGEQDG